MTPNMTPNSNEFWFIPLGGTGEIGMNLNLYGHNGRWLIVDCGITFEDQPPKNGISRSRVEMPLIDFAAAQRKNIVGIIATHAHEDHIGALPYLWEHLGCPIYTTPFTRNVLRNKFARSNCPALIQEVAEGGELALGPFKVTFIPMTHSTPETQGLVIDTPVGRVFHTADWKLDSNPVVGKPMATDQYQKMQRIDAVVCDSTNALNPASATSESEVSEGLLSAVSDAPGRVVVACFASNIARLQMLGSIAQQTGRHVGLLGFSMENMSRCAKEAGYLKNNFDPIDSSDIGYLPPNEVLVIATGSQGEPGAALHRLSTDSHPSFNLESGDHVILSAKTIPGNERSVELLMNRFERLGVIVRQADTSNLTLHASGHGGHPELAQMYEWVAPRAVIPVHGEPKHLLANANIAAAAGVPTQLVGQNGDLYDLVNLTIRSRAVPVGRMTLDTYGQLIRLPD
ncbi:MAG: ribonuclease J [Candidatus Azotimanducaceae bacterium]|jgi:ribonuclease J